MAKLYKMEMYIVDYNEIYNHPNDALRDILDDAENNSDCIFSEFNVEERNIEWNDDIDLNRINCSVETYRNYFKKGEKI